MVKKLLLKKIEEAISEFEKYQENGLITVGGINFETGALYPTFHIDHPSDVPIDEFYRNILRMYFATTKINTLCELYLEAYNDDRKVVSEIIQLNNQRIKKYESMIIETVSLVGELCKDKKKKK